MNAPASNLSVDPLSNVLAMIRATSSVSASLAAGGTWSLRFPAPGEIKFNALVHGECWMIAENCEPVHMSAGDCFLLLSRSPYVLASDPALAPAEARTVFSRSVAGRAVAGDGADVLIVGGNIVLDPVNASLLLAGLPPVIHVRGHAPEAAVLRWSLEQLASEIESQEPGSTLLADHLAQVMMILALRLHLASGDLERSWLKGLSDRRIARSLKLIHSSPGEEWSVAELADEAGMSRSNFSATFSKLVGVPPLSYLSSWRLNVAASLLRDGDASLSNIAGRTGYSSASAFSNAFKRGMGMPPIVYRRTARRA